MKNDVALKKSMRRRQTITSLVTTTLIVTMFGCVCFADPQSAAGGTQDATVAINNLTSFICGIMTTVGVLISLFGGFQFFTSFSDHQTQAKITGVTLFLSGICIAGLPWILVNIFQGTSIDTSALLPQTP